MKSILVAAVLWSLACLAHSQEAQGATEEKQAVLPVGPMLDVSARLTTANRVGESIYVVVSLKNRTDRKITLTSLTIEVDESAKDRFQGRALCKPESGEPVIPPNLSFEQRCKLDMKSGMFWLPEGSVRNLLFSAEVPLVVQIRPEKGDPATALPVVRVNAPQFGIFVGGLTGALMLAFFMWIERLLSDPRARERWGISMLVMCALGLRGGLMAIMALLLSSTTQGSASPISLDVNDFSGGVLVGLFSYPLANWIASTLKLDGVSAFGRTQAPGRAATQPE